jgi:signal transduction histidine kinase
VYVDGPAELALCERVASELFEMATEALSNIRRHTNAQHVSIGIGRDADAVSMRIENDGAAPDTPPFDPRSLSEHTVALGGTLEVRRDPGTTTVFLRIPL